MNTPEHLINELAGLCGIVPEYWDVFGTRHEAGIETKAAILGAMGIDATDTGAVDREIWRRRNYPWNCLVEPVLVVPANSDPLDIPVYLPVPEESIRNLSLALTIEHEDGSVERREYPAAEWHIEEERWIEGERHVKVLIPGPPRRIMGYYALHVEYSRPDSRGKIYTRLKRSRLIIAPDEAYLPPTLLTEKSWGLSLQLYGIRSRGNWGVGDFGDLGSLMEWAALLGGDFVGINPLHMLTNDMPYGVSPYSPVSRLFKNDIYLKIEKIPEAARSRQVRKLLRSPGFAAEIREGRQSRYVDYEKVSRLKRKALDLCFEVFYSEEYLPDTGRARDFAVFLEREGPALESFSLFRALFDHFSKTSGLSHWKDWPEPYRNPRSEEVRRFGADNRKAVLLHSYIQWLIDEQMQAVQADGRRRGMSLGIYHDLAFGSSTAGSDCWSYQDITAEGMDVGAPPDDFNINGQNWGFPPLIPERLREQGYELFISTIRNNMRHCGAIRIDHALGMFRLFWIPSGFSAAQGAYVRYPYEELLGIIALESVRNGTVVITEDLGTIGENVRDVLKRFRMLSYRLLYFERKYPSAAFTPPEGYPPVSLASVTTHDLPTLTGFWTGRDVEVKRDLGIFHDETTWEKNGAERARDRGLLLSALRASGIDVSLPADCTLQVTGECHQLCLAVYRFLAKSGSLLVSVSLDDILCVPDQQNMPGIVEGYPCWQQKSPVTIEGMRSRRVFERLAKAFADAGRSGAGRTVT